MSTGHMKLSRKFPCYSDERINRVHNDFFRKVKLIKRTWKARPYSDPMGIKTSEDYLHIDEYILPYWEARAYCGNNGTIIEL